MTQIVKKCNKCKFVKPIRRFFRENSEKCAKTCISCRYKHRKYYNNISKYIQKKRKCQSCVLCGETDWRVLQSDHYKGFKMGNVSNMTSLRRAELELAKTQPLCCNCHAKVTVLRRRTGNKLSNRNIKNYYEDIKRNEGCEMCGIVEDNFPSMFVFDHTDVGRKHKIGNIATMVSNGASKQIIDEELTKCRVLCANCHQIRTREQLKWTEWTDIN